MEKGVCYISDDEEIVKVLTKPTEQWVGSGTCYISDDETEDDPRYKCFHKCWVNTFGWMIESHPCKNPVGKRGLKCRHHKIRYCTRN